MLSGKEVIARKKWIKDFKFIHNPESKDPGAFLIEVEENPKFASKMTNDEKTNDLKEIMGEFVDYLNETDESGIKYVLDGRKKFPVKRTSKSSGVKDHGHHHMKARKQTQLATPDN